MNSTLGGEPCFMATGLMASFSALPSGAGLALRPFVSRKPAGFDDALKLFSSADAGDCSTPCRALAELEGLLMLLCSVCTLAVGSCVCCELWLALAGCAVQLEAVNAGDWPVAGSCNL